MPDTVANTSSVRNHVCEVTAPSTRCADSSVADMTKEVDLDETPPEAASKNPSERPMSLLPDSPPTRSAHRSYLLTHAVANFGARQAGLPAFLAPIQATLTSPSSCTDAARRSWAGLSRNV